MIYSRKAETLAALSATARWQSWQQPVNTFTGTVQLWLQEREGVSTDEAHVELETEDGPPAAPRAVFIITHHLEPKRNVFISIKTGVGELHFPFQPN